MSKKNNNNSEEEFVINFLMNNPNFFSKHTKLLNKLNFNSIINKSDKVIDLNAYKSKVISLENINLKEQIREILKAGKSHLISQKRVLRSSIKILNTKSLIKLIDLFVNDLKIILKCDIINCFCTKNDIAFSKLHLIDHKVAQSYFRNNSLTNLNQNPKGILLFFPNKSKLIKSYILLKINFLNNFFIIAMGSKNKDQFTPDMQVDLVEFLTKIIEIKLESLNLN
tara:strand:- start:310 stop:984 length:675 start_codon:yes stop_codon:yes gene_type:complete